MKDQAGISSANRNLLKLLMLVGRLVTIPAREVANKHQVV